MTEAAVIYPKAPIVEAVIDIQATVPEPADTRLLQFVSEVESLFPQKMPLRSVSMNVGPNNSHSVEMATAGWRLVNAASDRILQTRKQGFTLSHMPPYTHWGIFQAEAASLWQTFVATCQPERVTRIAVRYINRVRLPPRTIDLKDYLTIYPEVPTAYEPLEGLLMQLQGKHPDVDSKCASVITVATEPISDPAYRPIVLDLDLSVETDLSPNDPHCWVLFEKLRRKKNALFEAAITETTRETFR